MTNRELLQIAIPLENLSNTEWEKIIRYSEQTEKSDVSKILNKILVNQARIEVMSNYNDYYFDRLEDEI